jgi:hypothetical protein
VGAESRKSDGTGGRGPASPNHGILVHVHACDYRAEKFWARIRTSENQAVRSYQLGFTLWSSSCRWAHPSALHSWGRLVDLALAEELGVDHVDVRIVAPCDMRRNE